MNTHATAAAAADEREGVCRYTGLPLWTNWGGKRGYLPLILPLASEVGFVFLGLYVSGREPPVFHQADRCG
jgi:hypothetical protein